MAMRYLMTAMAQLQVAWLLLLCPALVHSMVPMAMPTSTPATVADTAPPTTLPGCPSTCGGINIPYPFGIGEGCSLSKFFNISCNRSYSPPRAYYSNFEVMNITLDAGELRVFTPISHFCYNSSNTTSSSYSPSSYNFINSSAFVISHARNEFTGVGCHNIALLLGSDRDDDGDYLSGCITTCASLDDAAVDGDACAGNGCCQTAMPRGLNFVMVSVNTTFAKTPPVNITWKYSNCNYGFIAEKGWYNFSRKHLNGTGQMSLHEQMGERTVPLVLDWAIQKDDACVSDHSERHDIDRDDDQPWYRCRCSDGYAGNPYVKGGCQNINECELRKLEPAIYEKQYPCGSNSKCRDTSGGYDCKCIRFHTRDGKSAKGCRPIVPVYAIAIAATFVALALLAVILWFVLTEHKRRLRKGFFDKHGGKLLRAAGINIYTEEDLAKITDRYRESIGKGHFGNVFVGKTGDNQQVAVKRAIIKDSKKTPLGGDFVDEILFQFQMRHSNLVRLVGCCLETDVPMLVFEFVPNGSLFDVLHGAAGKRRSLSLPERLDIAIGSAEALAYMHHSHTGDHKRIHGDVKSANILLDHNLSPKVSDFGSSKLMSTAIRYVRLVAADRNYLDPVYYKTGRFTERSDVYSFGVVLLEIITRKEAKYDESRSLSIDFLKSCKVEGNARKMYDRDIFTDGDAKAQGYMECLDRIGALAVRCLKEDEDDRPAMAEVVEELKQVKLRLML